MMASLIPEFFPWRVSSPIESQLNKVASRCTSWFQFCVQDGSIYDRSIHCWVLVILNKVFNCNKNFKKCSCELFGIWYTFYVGKFRSFMPEKKWIRRDQAKGYIMERKYAGKFLFCIREMWMRWWDEMMRHEKENKMMFSEKKINYHTTSRENSPKVFGAHCYRVPWAAIQEGSEDTEHLRRRQECSEG